MNGIKKYYFGLAAIALLTLVLFVYVLSLGGGYKRDKLVNEAATDIASELNSYVSKEQKIPESLTEVYSEEIPEEISYTKTNASKYKFCVTYTSQSGPDLNAESIVYQGLSGNFADQPYDYDFESSYTPSSLFISSYSWSAGEKCYDVEPRIYRQQLQRNNSSNFNNLNYVCDEEYQYYEFYKDDCVDGVYLRSSNSINSLNQ